MGSEIAWISGTPQHQGKENINALFHPDGECFGVRIEAVRHSDDHSGIHPDVVDVRAEAQRGGTISMIHQGSKGLDNDTQTGYLSAGRRDWRKHLRPLFQAQIAADLFVFAQSPDPG